MSIGHPNIPVLIAGNAMERRLCLSAISRQESVASFNFAASSPSPILGPTAWITYLAGSLPALVMAQEPVGTGPLRRHPQVAFLLHRRTRLLRDGAGHSSSMGEPSNWRRSRSHPSSCR